MAGRLGGAFIVCAAALGCSTPVRSLPDGGAPGREADVVARGAVFIATEGAETRYRVAAREGVYNDLQKRIRLSGVQARFQSSGEAAYEIESGEGFVQADTGDLDFPGPVHGRTSDGVRLEGSAFRYDAEKSVISSDDPVQVARAGFVLRGEGLRAYPREERFEILRGVRGQVERP